MGLNVLLFEQYDIDEHRFCVYVFDHAENWLQLIADEYCNLRTRIDAFVSSLTPDEIAVMDISKLAERLHRANVHRPPKTAMSKRGGAKNFEILRSDFGETLSYLILEELFGTRFKYKIVRDRETRDLAGRGTDAIGVENSTKLTLVMSEVKVSSEKRSPPRVVSNRHDSLHNQHINSTTNLEETANRVWDIVTRQLVTDPELNTLYQQAALFLDDRLWDKLDIVVHSLLVRPESLYKKTDFGVFLDKPDSYNPAKVRYIVVCIPDDIAKFMDDWEKAVENWGLKSG